jgi:hypothetical protein
METWRRGDWPQHRHHFTMLPEARKLSTLAYLTAAEEPHRTPSPARHIPCAREVHGRDKRHFLPELSTPPAHYQWGCGGGGHVHSKCSRQHGNLIDTHRANDFSTSTASIQETGRQPPRHKEYSTAKGGIFAFPEPSVNRDIKPTPLSPL